MKTITTHSEPNIKAGAVDNQFNAINATKTVSKETLLESIGFRI